MYRVSIDSQNQCSVVNKITRVDGQTMCTRKQHILLNIFLMLLLHPHFIGKLFFNMIWWPKKSKKYSPSISVFGIQNNHNLTTSCWPYPQALINAVHPSSSLSIKSILNSKINKARFARNVVKWDFLQDLQPLWICKIFFQHLAWLWKEPQKRGLHGTLHHCWMGINL